MGQLRKALSLARRRAIPLAASLFAAVACGSEPATLATSHEVEPSLTSLDYRFIMHSAGVAAQALALGSTASGRLELIEIDEPALLVGSVAIDSMQLRSSGQALATLGRGEWAFVARRALDGTIDGIWLSADMPPEAESLTRFLVSQLQRPTRGVAITQEQTPAGLLQARYQHFRVPLLHIGVRARRSPVGLPSSVRGATVFIEDERGPILVGSGDVTHTSVGRDPVVSASVLLAVRASKAPIAADELEQLRTRIELLSAVPPTSLFEQPLGKEEMDIMRRDAETWESVRSRLMAMGDAVDATLLGRAAAHLLADETLAAELQALAIDPTTPTTAAARMFAALGDCGSKPCQDALVAALRRHDSQIRVAVLAALGRVSTPAVETVDHLLALGGSSDEVTRSTTGIVLSRFAESYPDAAAVRVEGLIAGFEGCSEQLDQWFDLLGNAGLPASARALRACLDAGVPATRRAGAARAMRRIPGADVTQTLIRLAVDDASPEVQRAGLHALTSRDLRDEDLASFVTVKLDTWPAPALNLLLDMIEIVVEPGPSVGRLLEVLTRSSHEPIAKRALALANRDG